MKKLILKCGLYAFLLILMLEVWVRILHLSKDNPVRIVDNKRVEKWQPNQNGHSVTGNRRQNFSEYHINNSGFNSYREFTPSDNKTELALVGDSFIEGFHQHYYNSIGKKIENRIPELEVYEYGYAGYDMADQLHLINAYKTEFDKIDFVILGIKFDNDLSRGEYKVVQERMKLESPLYRNLRKIKLLVYAQNIGVIDIPKNLISKLLSFGKSSKSLTDKKTKSPEEIQKKELQHLKNLESLIKLYGFDKKRYIFLLDSRHTSPTYINYLKEQKIKYIDFGPEFEKARRSTTLIYDKHWNNYGRNLIADLIVKHLDKIQN